MRHAVWAILLLVLHGAAASAQEPADGRPWTSESEPTPEFASPFLPADHWALDAARRLAGLGLVDADFGWGERIRTRREVGAALERAVLRAEFERPELALLARGYIGRFAVEFPATMASLELGARREARMEGAIRFGYQIREGDALPGSGYQNGGDWTGPTLVDDTAQTAGSASMSLRLSPHFAAYVSGSALNLDWSTTEAYGVAAWRNLGVWGGRRSVGYGPGVGGGIVLSGGVPFDGGGISLLDPVLLPGFLRHLGPLRFETFLARAGDSGAVQNPWLWSARGSILPHPRLGIGISRAAVFGGEGNPLTAKNLLFMLVGKHGGAISEFENQMMAVDVHWRLPVPALPTVAYVQWGFEDSAGAWRDTPGIVAGLEVPAVPGLPELAVGLERTSFAGSCCGNPIWYRHREFAAGWTGEGRPLGHPLGGHGREWLVFGRADLLSARLRIELRGYLRERGSENLFAPDRAGRSRGGTVHARMRIARKLEVSVRGAIESGEASWRESSVFAAIGLFF